MVTDRLTPEIESIERSEKATVHAQTHCIGSVALFSIADGVQELRV